MVTDRIEIHWAPLYWAYCPACGWTSDDYSSETDAELEQQAQDHVRECPGP